MLNGPTSSELLGAEWPRSPIARITYSKQAGEWTLHYADRNDRFRLEVDQLGEVPQPVVAGRDASFRSEQLSGQNEVMEIMRHVVVFDAADLSRESAFWAAMLGGRVFTDDRFHTVFDAEGNWRIGVQLAPDHTPPDWPDGVAQQVHLDLHVTDPNAAHAHALALGARLLKDGDPTTSEGHRVYADPAGHPFCIGWGHPDNDAVREFLRGQPD